ncbi:hypothetical protein JMJ77_0002636, partial [Colletotrichum scovillei]
APRLCFSPSLVISPQQRIPRCLPLSNQDSRLLQERTPHLDMLYASLPMLKRQKLRIRESTAARVITRQLAKLGLYNS